MLGRKRTRFIFQQRAVDPNQKQAFETPDTVCGRRRESVESRGDNHRGLTGIYSPSYKSTLLAHFHQAPAAWRSRPPDQRWITAVPAWPRLALFKGWLASSRCVTHMQERPRAAQTLLALLGGTFGQGRGFLLGAWKKSPLLEIGC